MIDTVTIFSPSELLVSNSPTGWKHSISYKPIPDPDGIGFVPERSFWFDDPKSGYHAYGKRDEMQYHRASLARLLHGHNSMLIKSQTELDAALKLLQLKAGEVCNASFASLHFSRVDLVWQFRGDTANFILAHRNARHLRIRSGPSFYEARSMAFKGSEMRITFYDKVREQTNHDGNVVRVEVQLKGRVLKELLGNGNQVTKLDFYQCYRAYRRVLFGFEPSPIPNVSKIAEFLAIGERAGWNSDGVSAFDIYTKYHSPKQVQRIRKAMAACRPDVFKIDWQQILPVDSTPPAVELL